MPDGVATKDVRSFVGLTRAHLGESQTTWIGSVGYERFKVNTDFSRMLAEAGVERLLDVRDLPISRRRGFAKTKLGEALAGEGIEYVHVKALGNPKPIRDLYKAGHPVEGRRLYESLLLAERREALDDLAVLLGSKRTALMCVEHDPATCHRTVIVEALQTELGLDLDVVQLG